MKHALKIAVMLLAAVTAGCAGTRDAYQAAQNADALPDTAYVIAEHYSAVLQESVELKESGRVPASAVAAMQRADAIVKPAILGDPSKTPPTPGLKQLADNYRSVRDAKTEADLQKAINEAVLNLSKLMDSVKAARSTT